MAIPYVTISNITKTKLSDEVGFQTTDLTFSFDTPVYIYTIRCNGIDYQTGVEIERKELTVAKIKEEQTVASLRNLTVQDMRIILANTPITIEVAYTDLYQQGENRINVYGKSDTDEWTPYGS
jgi:hypothetical protein